MENETWDHEIVCTKDDKRFRCSSFYLVFNHLRSHFFVSDKTKLMHFYWHFGPIRNEEQQLWNIQMNRNRNLILMFGRVSRFGHRHIHVCLMQLQNLNSLNLIIDHYIEYRMGNTNQQF